jgi:cytochrome bd-type quinol oxidase subunit 2
MKKLFYSLVAAIMSAPTAALAQSATPTTGQFGTSPSGTGYDVSAGAAGLTTGLTFYQILTFVMNWLIAMLGIGAVISFVIAGILYLLAAGDEAKTEKAKNIMTYAIIAVVVAMIGFIVLRLIANFLGNANIGTGI